MRTFIAIELTEEIRKTLEKLQEELKRSGADVKWVTPKNIHLTLKFLGDLNEKRLPQIKEALEEVAKNNSAFPLRFSTLGAFPNMNSPRVIWAGIDQGDNETKAIAIELEEKIAKIGIPKEKREFSSHITLGRTRSDKNLDKLVKEIKRLENPWAGKNPECLIKTITLFQSSLFPLGPTYTALKEASLKTT